MKKESMRSPKNKFFAHINTEKPLSGIGQSFSVGGMTLEEAKHNATFYTKQAEDAKVGWYVKVTENKATYPNFDWQDVELYQADKRMFNGGNRNAGRKSRQELGMEAVVNTTVQVEKSIIDECREKHGSLANALRFAAKH